RHRFTNNHRRRRRHRASDSDERRELTVGAVCDRPYFVDSRNRGAHRAPLRKTNAGPHIGSALSRSIRNRPPPRCGDSLGIMLDREIILRLLEDVARRQRKNRMLRDASAGLSMSLLVLVGFKVIDLISPFRGTTVVAIVTEWAIGTAAWLGWRLRGNV